MAVLSGEFYGLKNGPGLVKAFAWAARRAEGARLVVYGNGCEATGRAAAWAHRAFPDLAVEFRGAVHHDRIIRALREECDILLHPSRTESFGMVLLEAMAQGLPVVGGIRSGSVPWLLEGGEAGRLADITSPADFGKAILELLEKPELRRALGQRGQERARRHFTLEAMTKAYLELLEGVRARRLEGEQS
jgi:glycosyltransferase involved in cell wall biosynthesis